MKKYQILNEADIRENNSYEFCEISPFDAGIPLVELSDKTIEEIYYYRWHSFCSHIKNTPLGYIVTEFTPSVPWEGLYGSIVCPAGHQMYEGRWLHNTKYLDDYARFWFCDGADPMLYSTWLADSTYAMCKVWGDFTLAKSLYPKLCEHYEAIEKRHRMTCLVRLLYQIDDRDGMEFSASGNGCRPTINSYHYGDAVALSKIAGILGKEEEKEYYISRYTEQKQLMDTAMWDKNAEFYKNVKNGYWLCDVREITGYIPWYFGMPDEDKNGAWKFLNDENYFYAPYGPTTAERNYPDFMKSYSHMCLWNGPSWPFSTSQTLTALANFICDYNQDIMGRSDYYKWLKLYAGCQYSENEKGERIPAIDENLHPFTGEWFTKKMRIERGCDKAAIERGIHYNHSSFCDLVLSGLAGVRPRDDDKIEICPLFEKSDLEYFCADGILYHNHYITVMWDKTGEKYGRGKGLFIYIDGELKAENREIGKIII